VLLALFAEATIGLQRRLDMNARSFRIAKFKEFFDRELDGADIRSIL
tara:strand:+ start:856 stop:996 length:141 start_codon:yes stop_codon:yes gene_type:complete